MKYQQIFFELKNLIMNIIFYKHNQKKKKKQNEKGLNNEKEIKILNQKYSKDMQDLESKQEINIM